MLTREFAVQNPAQWAEVVAAVQPWLLPGRWAALEGPLGAGKTTFVQALVRTLSPDTALEVTSPTFALYHDYPTQPAIRHYDLYRVGDDLRAGHSDAAAGVDLDYASWQDVFVLVEWPDRLPHTMPPPCWSLSIRPTDDGGRLARLRLLDS